MSSEDLSTIFRDWNHSAAETLSLDQPYRSISLHSPVSGFRLASFRGALRATAVSMLPPKQRTTFGRPLGSVTLYAFAD